MNFFLTVSIKFTWNFKEGIQFRFPKIFTFRNFMRLAKIRGIALGLYYNGYDRLIA
uniref:Uncharacterized protein n=1 Tax=Rhizophagus irregularis (strain DAOM 181602 / DAOM 197198 / MUCL 43194) TaxID=747089 RepID=U9UQ91_RHIID